MRTVMLRGTGDLTEWRDAARDLLAAGVRPEQVDWRVAGQATLFAADDLPRPSCEDNAPAPLVPRGFLELAEAVICHTDPGRFALLYRLLTRLLDARALLSDVADPDVAAARRLEKSVRRDCHKMTAFVRFREVPSEAPGNTQRRRFVAWFEPDHHIVARKAPFFVRRFADMDWAILTPKGSAMFENGTLAVSDAPAEKPDLADPTDALWLTYYASIFNPARLKPAAMRAEMPKKYWANLPEAALIPTLLAEAPARVAAMAARLAGEPPLFHTRLQARARGASRPRPEDSPK